MNDRRRARTDLLQTLLLFGAALMIPCYVFTAGNTLLAPWPLYGRNRPALCLLTLGTLALLLMLFRFLSRHEVRFARREKRILVGMLLFYFAVQLVMGQALRFVPITDLEQCYTAAQLLADTGEFGHMERPFIYFTRYPHNLGLVYFLSMIFRFFGFFGWTDRFMQAVFVCSLLFSLGFFCAAKLCKTLGGTRAEMRMLLLSALCLPFLYCTTELYTDAFSLSFATVIVCCFVYARKAQTGRGRVRFALLFAAASFIGAQLRFPSVIASMACLIAALFERRVKLTALLALPLALVFAVGTSAIESENAKYLGAENIAQYQLPKLHYIAMGLPVQVDEGYGQFGEGGWLVFSTSFDTPAERDAALRQQVIDRVYYLRYPNRLLHMLSRKNLSTFGTGTFVLNEIFEGDEHEPNNAVKQVIFYAGKYYPAYYHLCTAMLTAQMLLACLACAQAIRRRSTDAAPLFITLLGAFLFLSMWETRGRYFFQFEMLLLCAAAQLDGLALRHSVQTAP